MRFCIIIPTIRKSADTTPAIARVWTTGEHLIDLHVIDGDLGKSATLNDAIPRLVDPARHDYVVTMDDDILLPPHWQSDCIAALDAAGLSAVGIDLSHTEKGVIYMSEVNPWQEIQGPAPFRIRPLHACNIVGCFICMRAETALAIGQYPWDGKTRYEFDEDGWRCARIRMMGGKLGYVETRGGLAEMIYYSDEPGYLARKAADSDYIRNVRGIAR